MIRLTVATKVEAPGLPLRSSKPSGGTDVEESAYATRRRLGKWTATSRKR
jgi:hypothetical protein